MGKFRDMLRLNEMANFGTNSTGLKEVIWVSVKNANHGPRIKIYEGKTAKGKNFSVTIEDRSEGTFKRNVVSSVRATSCL